MKRTVVTMRIGYYPIRILHIVHILNRGGMESRIMDIYRKINKERFQFDFYVESGEEGVFDKEIISLGGKIFYASRKNLLPIPNFIEFRHFLKKHQYTIVYAYNQWSGYYLKCSKMAGVKYRIANARTSLEAKNAKNYFKNIVKLNVNSYATHRFAVSKKAGLWLYGRKKMEQGKVTIWPNAIDAEKFAYSKSIRKEVQEELHLTQEDYPVVIHVGNIRPEKNHVFLLDVYSKIHERFASSKLILIGSGNYESLESKINKLNLSDSIIYMGVRKDVNRILQAGDVFIFPSLYEGFPGSVLEAECSGLKCIVSDSITDEILLTDSIIAKSLSDEPECWMRCIDKLETVDREKAWITIREKGYDIQKLVSETERFWEQLFAEGVD